MSYPGVLLRVGLGLVGVTLLGWLPADLYPDPRALIPGLGGLMLLLLAGLMARGLVPCLVGSLAALLSALGLAALIVGLLPRLGDAPWLLIGSMGAGVLVLSLHESLRRALRRRRVRHRGLARGMVVLSGLGLVALGAWFLSVGYHEVLPLLCPSLAASFCVVVPISWARSWRSCCSVAS